jgi:hypothetical protein
LNRASQFNQWNGEATRSITKDWWNNPNYAATNGPAGIGSRVTSLGHIAFAWQMTRNPAISNANPGIEASIIADEVFKGGLQMQDAVSGNNVCYTLAYVYDWLYEIMTDAQRARVLSALDHYTRFLMRSYWWQCPVDRNFGWRDPTGEYAGPARVLNGHAPKRSEAHSASTFQFAMVPAIVAYNDNQNITEMFNAGLNYMIAYATPAGDLGGMNVGRGYGWTYMFQFNNLMNYMYLQILFPEAAFTNHPGIKAIADWYDHNTPVGFSAWNDGFGDGGPYGMDWIWKSPLVGQHLAWFTQSGEAMQHFNNAKMIGGFDPSEYFRSLPLGYYFTDPKPRTNTTLAKVWPHGGWAIAHNRPANEPLAFKNMVGFVLMARPGGSENNHSQFNDLNFQLWAYGATITDSGANGLTTYGHIADAHYCLLVDGRGIATPNRQPNRSAYASIFAFTNGSDFTYAAADATCAYPHTAFNAGGNIPDPWMREHSSGQLAKLTKARRHIVFPRRKYFVIYDELATTSNSTFSWLYHILEPTLTNLTSNSFTYTCTNYFNRSNVTVYVKHIENGVDVMNMSGNTVRSNPVLNIDWSRYGDTKPRANALWFQNKVPATNWHFLTVIYPVKGGDGAPVITRLDDYTVRVLHGDEEDVISFDAANTNATLAVDLAAVASGLPVSRPGPR